jgi:hypothetical protein
MIFTQKKVGVCMAVYVDSTQVGTVEVTTAPTAPTVTTVDLSSMLPLIGMALVMTVVISLIKAVKKR